MKKILSILVMCVILGVGNVWAQGKVQVNAYACINEKSTTNLGGGEVQAHAASRDRWSGSDWNSGARAIKSQIEGSEALGRLSQTHYKVSYSADAYPNNGYYFSHWLNEEGKIITGKGDAKNGIKDIEHPWVGSGIAPVNVYAIFKPVSITTDKPIIQIDSKDKEQYAEETITFNVVGVDAMSDFLNSDVMLSGDSRFSIPAGGGAIFSGDKNNGTVTVTIRYTDDNHHILNSPFPTATLTLTSAGKENSQAITITATSDLSPYFTVSPSLCDFSPSNPLELGAETQTKTLNISASSITAGEGTWSAYFKDSEDAGVKGYALDASDPQNPKVLFTPQAAYNNQANIETILCVKCEYQDATPQIVPYVQEITLSADVGKVFTINALTNAIMTFDVIDYSEINNPVSMEYPVYTTLLLSDFHVTEDLHGVTYATTIEGKGSLTDKIIVTAQSNLTPGEHVSTLVYKEKDGDLETSLTINVPIRLAKPIVEVVEGIGLALELDWQDVYGATSYIIKSEDTHVMTIEKDDEGNLASYYKVSSIAGKSLVVGKQYSFTVTAVYAPNAFGNRTSKEILATPSAPAKITSTTVLDLYTGTDKSGSRPYHKDGKRLVDLSATFKDGVAVFDQLFVFGLTTGVDGSHTINSPTTTKNSDAVTPCYIYKKSGSDYILSKTIPNVNIATKPADFSIKASGQKIYFTGYAPYASCGSTWDENGVFFITGSGTTIDLYLDNLELYARPKAETGTVVPKYSFEVYDVSDLGSYGNSFNLDIQGTSTDDIKVDMYAQGSGSAFCFKSTSSSTFTPKLHLNGENILQSTQGMSIEVIVKVDMTVPILNKHIKLDYGPVVATQHSSPIQVVHDKETIKNPTMVTIDDLWGNEIRTNGFLNLAAGSDVRPAPTVDLGNDKTTLVVDGGQLLFSNSYNSSDDYSVSYAISYRVFSGLGGRATMYGIGSDQPGGTVKFTDGTIRCQPLPDIYFNTEIGQKLYHNTTSMKCPSNTIIDGGTFSCDVLACATSTSKGTSPKNSKGDALCMIEIPIKSVNTNGTAVLTDDWMTYAFSNGASTSDLDYYGIESLTPETVIIEDNSEQQMVKLLLPSKRVCFKEEIITPWVMCYPELIVSEASTGGDVKVPYSITKGEEGKTIVKKTSKLFYGEIDQIFMAAILGDYRAPGDLTVSLPSYVNAIVENTDEYVVYDKIYMMIPVIANQWKMFVPPFDVANVYVVESYPEEKLLQDFGTDYIDAKGKTTKKIQGENIEKARYAQSWRMLDLFYQWVWNVDQMKNTSDFWSNDKRYAPIGQYESMGSFVQLWMDMYDPEYRPIIEQLYHYTSDPSAKYPDGKYWWDANFYLYEADGKEWNVSADGLDAKWKEVTTVSQPRAVGAKADQHSVIMRKGGIYVINFPSTIVNSEEQNFLETWDYWSGKYIILEGYPETEIDTDGDGELDSKGQVLEGASAAVDILAEYFVDNSALLKGNYTFSNMNITGLSNAFMLNNYMKDDDFDAELIDPDYDHNVYVANTEVVDLTPAQGFLLANIPDPENKIARAINVKDGSIIYSDVNDNTPTSTPTIAGNKQMMVYNIEGGVGIVPVVAQQVSIYNAAGQLVTSEYLTDEVHISLPTGIYLIAGTQDQFKAVVK